LGQGPIPRQIGFGIDLQSAPVGSDGILKQHIYAELRLPFDAALDAAEADLLREQNEGPERGRTAVANPHSFLSHPPRRCTVPPTGKFLSQLSDEPQPLVVVV